MKKRRLLGLILFANVIIAGMFFATELMIHQSSKVESSSDLTKQDATEDKEAGDSQENTVVNKILPSPSVETLPTQAASSVRIEEATAGFATDIPAGDTYEETTETIAMPKLIIHSSEVDYESYIPEMKYDDELNHALDIDNPKISIDASAAILFDAATKQVIYYKNPVQAVFPASTIKLLTALLALDWCSEEEEVTVGDEIKLIASDSTRADLHPGEILTIRSLLEGMLLPSGNDAAYAVAAYVGRKSLDDPKATKEEAVMEFVRLMNKKAKDIGVKNSCFKTPDGYDAVGQYTTAYDMGLIGMAAAACDTIVTITGHSSIRTTFISGEDVTWNSTNKLISRYSGEYYSKAIGLKTGTSTMAGRCIIAAAKTGDREVVCVVLDSTLTGRWEDAIKLLKYGLNQ